MPKYRAIIADAHHYRSPEDLPDNDPGDSLDAGDIGVYDFVVPDDGERVAHIYAHAIFFDNDWCANDTVSKVIRID